MVIKGTISKYKIQQIIQYLKRIGSNSLPNYIPIEKNCPNFHRINMNDERAYVEGCFHQFSFFPWNQDLLHLFELFKDVYHLKNSINDQPIGKYLGKELEQDCIARLSFQFYPAGAGYLNKHQDPVGDNQLAVPILIMSQKGKDFTSGGLYAMTSTKGKLYADEIAEPGDIVLINPKLPHGVDIIDSETEPNWLTFNGRWMMIAATNKMQGSNIVADAIDIEKLRHGSA